MTPADKPCVVFDGGPLAGGTTFRAPRRIITATTPDDVSPAFAQMQQAQADGFWLAGHVAYEFGYLASSKLRDLMPDDRDGPLLQFGVFDAPLSTPEDLTEPAPCTEPVPQWDQFRYAQAFAVVYDYIAAGDIYQANLTFPLLTTFDGSAAALYAHLRARQPVPYGAYVDLGGAVLLSRSPELFFSLTADGKLTTRPMKGTAPRGVTPAEDDALRAALQASEKNRAENLMIVDLLRNDMSRVSEVGSVKVPDLFAVERFATVHQMTSTITSQLCAGTTLSELFHALFPCGSVTGAPKVRAMQIIQEVEAQPRGAYCGAIGWIAPDGAMEFNVAIRTLTVTGDQSARLNVGGGVVYDSTATDEYAEALLKSRFVVVD